MVVYCVARWCEVFETSESRKFKRLPWIAERTDFNSTGWQQGLDHFGAEKWLQIYGAWMVIVRVAAAAKVRGRLSGDKGEPYSAARIARPAGVDPAVVSECIQWAAEVGWLVPVSESPGESPDNLPAAAETFTTTERYGTERNGTITERNGTEPAAEPSRADDVEQQNTGAKNTSCTPKSRSIPPSSSVEKRTSSEGNRPGRVSFATAIERSELLQQLEQRPVTSNTPQWLGSVFGRDRLRPDMVTTGNAWPFLAWYVRQLNASSPAMTGGNQAEAALAVALMFAVRRLPDSAVKSSRLAIWISAINQRDAAAVTENDLKRAAEAVAEFFGTELPAAAPRPAAPPPPPAKPVKQRTTRSVVEALAKLREAKAGAES